MAIVLVVYVNARVRGFSENEVRTLTFTTIVVANHFLILTNRSWSETVLTTLRTPNKAMWWVFFGTISCLLLVLYVPFLQALFGSVTVPFTELIVCAVAGALSIVWFECFKYWNAGNR